MSNSNHMATITELAESEGGVFTAAQAARLGVPRDALSHAARAGRLERVVRGAYRVAGSPPSELDLAAALWKLTDPRRFAHERVSPWDGTVIGGRTAAFALGIGDLRPYPCGIYAPRRLRTALADARTALRRVDERDVTFRLGFPVTRPERTVFDLVLDGEDLSLVCDALRDAQTRLARADFDEGRLAELLLGGGGRWGVPVDAVAALRAVSPALSRAMEARTTGTATGTR